MQPQWTIPGTMLKIKRDDAARVDGLFQSMFLTGGMVLSQVSNISGLEPYAVQNWVKRGFLSPPQRKRYSMNQVCRIININMLKSALPMEDICGLLQYINGDLDDESDDLIDDAALYFLFVRLAAHHRQMNNAHGRDEYLEKILEGYAETAAGAKERVKKVLQVMLTAWAASLLRQQAETMVAQLKNQ